MPKVGRAVLVAYALVTLSAAEAEAKLLVSPPILGKGLEPARDIIEQSISGNLRSEGIPRITPDQFLEVKLKQCKNKMSCLSTVAKPAGADHVLHVILARRGTKVLAQFTLLDVNTVRPAETVRVGSGLGLSLIEKAVSGAAAKIVAALKAMPMYNAPAPVAAVPTPAPIPRTTVPTPTPTPVAMTPTPMPTPTPAPAVGMATPGLPTVASPNPAVQVETSVPMVRGTNYLAISVGGIGILSAMAGGVAFILSAMDISERDGIPQTQVAERQRLREAALTKQTIGAGLIVGGVGAIGLGTLFYLTGWGASSYPAPVTPAAPGAPGFVLHF